MKYKIFQTFFDNSQVENLEPMFHAFDNTENKHPELREYHVFRRAINHQCTEDLDAWGVWSWRWAAKSRYPAETVLEFIDNNPDADVYVFNHARVHEALTVNVWEQGEFFHSGISTLAKCVLNKLGYDDSPFNSIMSTDIYCFSSYFVAKRRFWDEYMGFLDSFVGELNDLDEEMAAIYRSSAKYPRDKSLNMFVFLIERLFSTYLLYNSSHYEIRSLPPDYTVYKHEFIEKVISALSYVKSKARGDSRMFTAWDNLRKLVISQNKSIFNLDL